MLTYLIKWRTYFIYGGLFSLFITVLQLAFMIYNMVLFEKVLTSYSVPTLVAITIMAVMATVAGIMLDVVRSRLLVRLGIQMDLDLSEEVFQSMMREVSGTPQGQTTASLYDVTMLRNYCSGAAIFTYFDLPVVPICLALIFYLHPMLGVLSLCGGLVTIGLGILAERLTRTTLDEASLFNARSSHLVSQSIRNSEAVMGMSMMPGIMTKWRALNTRVMNLQTLASQRAGLLHATIRGLRSLMMIAVYAVGAYLVVTSEITTGMMIAAAIAMGKALGPVDTGMAAYKPTLEAVASYRRLHALFGQGQSPRRMDMPAPKGNLACEAVTFVAQGRPILQGVSFQLEAGQTMGLIGPSAAGKSTLCRLLVGIWPPYRGAIRLDGVDIHSWDANKRGVFMGYLPQDVELFSGTVAENIARLGPVDSEKVIAAARMAGAHEMILQFPGGYDTEIGTSGAVLSGGQRQRIGLARAVYGNPSLLVLDEPSSNLDDDGERALASTISQMKQQGATVIMVSHKPATIAHVDMLLVLKAGQVILFGPRENVLKQLVGGAAARVPSPQRIQQ